MAQQPRITDIALARLSTPVTDVTPLALSTARPTAGALLTVAGWGATTSINPTPATRLSTGIVKIRTVESSLVTGVGYSPATDTSACLYDSGDPYFTTNLPCPRGSSRLRAPDPTAPTPARRPPRVDTITGWVTAVTTAVH